MRVRGRRSAGFSAIEVLIAIAVAAIGILAVASMFPSSYTNVTRSGTQTSALALAQQEIEFLRNQVYTALPGMAGTQTIPNYPNYTRTVAVTVNPDWNGNAAVDPDENGTTRVTVTVTAPNGTSVTMISLIGQ